MKQKTGDAEKAYKTVTIDAEKALKTFFEKWKNISLLGEIKGLLGWDQDTMIASGEVSARGEQAELIARMKHKELTDPELHELTQWLYDRPGKFDWDPATLAGLKEALHHSVIVAVAFAAHAWSDAVELELLSKRIAGVLAALIRVVDKLFFRDSLVYGHPESIDG